MQRLIVCHLACLLSWIASPAHAAGLTSEQMVAALRQASSSIGDIADAVEQATGMCGFMYHDMTPIFKIVGQPRSSAPATSVGRYVSVAKQCP